MEKATQWTIGQHLGSWIFHHVPYEMQGAFQEYAERAIEDDQARWENEGWGKLYGNFLADLNA